MRFFLVCFVFPIIDAFVAVKIHQNSLYDSIVPCSFIRNSSWSNDVSIDSCIWECINEYDCQTAVFFKTDKICSMFKEECQQNSIQSSGNDFINVICYRKNHSIIFHFYYHC
jgi:hypothetical protein